MIRFMWWISLLSVCFSISLARAGGTDYSTISQTSTPSADGKLVRVATVIQQGSDPQNRFTISRIVAADNQGQPVAGKLLRGAIVLLSGTYENFANMYDDPNDSTRIGPYLATRGYDVYGYNPRTMGWDGKCNAAGSCAVMRGWGLDTYISDIEFVRAQANAANPGKNPILGGYSFGSMIAFSVLNADPAGWAGAMLTEGGLYSKNPAITGPFTQVCAGLSSASMPTVTTDGQNFKPLAKAGLEQPDAMSPEPPLTNKQYLLAALTTPSNPPDGVVPGYTLIAGDINGLRFSPLSAAVGGILSMNDYDPGAVYRDAFCTLAGNTHYVQNLAQFTGPSIVFMAGHGFGRYMQDSLDLLSSSPMEQHFNPDFGHGDYYGSFDHVVQWESVIEAWTAKIFPLVKSGR